MASSMDFDPKLGTSVAGLYRLDRRLAAGGMGVVYQGERIADGHHVAVKFLHEAFAGLSDLVKRFQREVDAMRLLSHPNLASIIDSGVSAGVPYLVMDFHAGKALAEILDKGPLPATRAVAVARQVLAGVAHAHQSGVLHRDLKPDNIMLVDDGDGVQVKILDFGLAKMVSEEEATQLTNTGFALGTPGYMSPEQARGTETDERTDLYAVGVVLYHMVVGRKPFVADSAMAVLRMHMEDAPMPPRKAAPERKLSAKLETAILRALEKDPARRWSSAEEFASKLAATPEGRASEIPLVELSMHEIPATERTTTARRRPKKNREREAPPAEGRRPRPRRWGWIAAVTLLVLVAGGTWAGLWKRQRQQVKHQIEGAVEGAVSTAKGAMSTAKGAVSTAKGAVSNAKDTLRNFADRANDPTDSRAKPGAPPASDDDDREEPVAAQRDTPGARLETEAPERSAPQKKPPRIDDAQRLLNAGKDDQAIQVLYMVRKQAPKSVAVALLLGHAYFHKVWRTDGLREYDTALQLRPSLRYDKQLVKNVIGALDDPTGGSARTLIRTRLGASALAELRRAARDSKNPKVQKRAGRLALVLAPARRGKRR